MIIKSLVDILFPAKCLACDATVTEMGTLCHNCWLEVDFNNGSMCAICGYPFDYQVESGTLCGACIKETPSFCQSRSVFRYNKRGKQLVHRLKYSDKTYLAPYLAKWMRRSAQDILTDADFLMPVPLHRYRLLSRSYNQSALLAIELGKICAIKTLPTGLLRVKNTKPQAGLNIQGRADNLRNAFAVNIKHKLAIQGKNIVLIDDVFTTGATINACSKILLKAKCQKVSVLSMARTVLE